MKKLREDLWQSSRYCSGMLNTHAYFLKRDTGNILFYNTADTDDLAHIDELGGIAFQFLTHRDESGASLNKIRRRFDSILAASDIEAPYINADCEVDLILDSSVTHLQDIHIIHTPGHTDGSVCYYYDNGQGESYLFTGDTFFLANGAWSTFVLQGSGGTNASLINSLETLRELRPSVVISSGFVGEIAFKEVTQAEWISEIDTAIARLRRSLC